MKDKYTPILLFRPDIFEYKYKFPKLMRKSKPSPSFPHQYEAAEEEYCLSTQLLQNLLAGNLFFKRKIRVFHSQNIIARLYQESRTLTRLH